MFSILVVLLRNKQVLIHFQNNTEGCTDGSAKDYTATYVGVWMAAQVRLGTQGKGSHVMVL